MIIAYWILLALIGVISCYLVNLGEVFDYDHQWESPYRPTNIKTGLEFWTLFIFSSNMRYNTNGLIKTCHLSHTQLGAVEMGKSGDDKRKT